MTAVLILSPLIISIMAGAAFALHHCRRLLDQRQGRVVAAAQAWRARPSVATDRALCAAVDAYEAVRRS
jgi:hypothetical protein